MLSTGCAATGWLCAFSGFSNPDFGFTPGPRAYPLSKFVRPPPLPSPGGRAPPAGVFCREQSGCAGGGRGTAPRALICGVSVGPRRPASHPSPAVSSPLPRPHPSTLGTPSPSRRSRATSGGVTQIPACRWRLPSPVSRKDSLLFCASALFLWRGRSRDSSRALASAPCISPMESDGGARSRRGRQENTDVSLKEPP